MLWSNISDHWRFACHPCREVSIERSNVAFKICIPNQLRQKQFPELFSIKWNLWNSEEYLYHLKNNVWRNTILVICYILMYILHLLVAYIYWQHWQNVDNLMKHICIAITFYFSYLILIIIKYVKTFNYRLV